MSNKPNGFITRLLAIDTETSGLFFGSDDPSYNQKTKQTHQLLSIGLIVVDAITLAPIEELYVEVKWDPSNQWDTGAEKVHGLSRQYLEENGVSTSEAVELIANLLISHWGPSAAIHILGHNPQFDLAFLRRLLRTEELEFRWGNKMVDTNSIGFVVFNTHNSDDLFESIGAKTRGQHNALEDIRNSLKVVQVTRQLADIMLGDD
jgi:oligoribonuclease (3'-5' exoribonuclease)